MKIKFIALVMIGFCAMPNANAQKPLHLTDAFNTAVQHYEKIKAKEAIQGASQQNIFFQQKQLLPDFTLAAQQSYGTVNAQHGPLYSYGGLGAASTSMPTSQQDWNAAFGSLYLANINWNLFTFGRVKSQIRIAQAANLVSQADLQQEIFQHQVKVGAAYFSLLAAQRLKYVQERNLHRAEVFLTSTEALAGSGLIPGVNLSLAKAEVSNAQSATIKAYDWELEFSKALAVLMGENFRTYQLDSQFHYRAPQYAVTADDTAFSAHPSILFRKYIVEQSQQEVKAARAQTRPSLSAFGVLQGRGSGFAYNYVQENTAYSSAYLDGVGIDRSNYILGISLSWNISNLYRYQSKVKSQQLLAQASRHEYNLLRQELSAQDKLADEKLKNALRLYEESKIQVTAATDAFRQSSALYNNGLTTITDWTQTLYSLNRAEVEFEIALNNAWQALLLKAAAQGDLNILINETK